MSDFEYWTRETFTAKGGKLRIGSISNPHALTREQGEFLVRHLAELVESLPTLDERLGIASADRQ